MLRHAFEEVGCIRVELKTDRDTVYYSILDSEWPRVRAHLEAKLGRT